MGSERFLESLKRIRPRTRRFVDINLEIIHQLNQINLSCDEASNLLGISVEDYDNMFRSTYNFTLKELTLLEEVLDIKILINKDKHDEK